MSSSQAISSTSFIQMLRQVKQQEANLQEWQIGREIEQPSFKPQIDPQRSEQNFGIDEWAEKARQKFKEFLEERLGELEQHSQTYGLLIEDLGELMEQQRQADAGLPLLPIKSLIEQSKQSTDLLREQIKGELEQPIFKQRIVHLSSPLEIEEQVKQIAQAKLRLEQHFNEYFRQIESFNQNFEPLVEQCIRQRVPTDMTTMQTEMYDALREAGASEEKARAAAMNVPAIEQVATKEGIAKLETKMTERLGKLGNDMLARMGKLEADMVERMGKLEAKITERMAKLETKMTERMAKLETKMTERMGKLEAKITERLGDITERMGKLETKMTERLGDITERMDKLETKMTERLGEMTERMGKLESSMLKSMIGMGGIIIISIGLMLKFFS